MKTTARTTFRLPCGTLVEVRRIGGYEKKNPLVLLVEYVLAPTKHRVVQGMSVVVGSKKWSAMVFECRADKYRKLIKGGVEVPRTSIPLSARKLALDAMDIGGIVGEVL